MVGTTSLNKEVRKMRPVVGTILMVAVTITLAMVLWLMVDGMIGEFESETIDVEGVVIDKSEEPEYNGYWIIVENEEEGKSYIIRSKSFWLGYDIDNNFTEEDIPVENVEEI